MDILQFKALSLKQLGYGLNDSPVGLAGWIIEKFHGWTKENTDQTGCSLDEDLAIVSLYWYTESITSSARFYYENGPLGFTFNPVSQPMAGAIFKNEIARPPRVWAEKIYNIVQWNQYSGGHFAALENPEILADDIFSFAQIRNLKKISFKKIFYFAVREKTYLILYHALH